MIRNLLLIVFAGLFFSRVTAATSLAAGSLSLDGDYVQGGMVIGRTEAGARVTLDGRRILVSPEGLFVFGFGRDAPGEAVLEVLYADGGREEKKLQIAPRRYEIQRIDGLPPRMVTPPAAALARIRRENARIADVRARTTPAIWFAEPFAWPAEGPVTGVYGSQRILNGEPRQPHFGLDIGAPEGAPVYAPQSGIVALAEHDLYYTGGTIMLDHGHGVTSVLMHLSAVEVAVGDDVERGAVVGRVGKTGRVTGAHLDWRVNWFTTRLDPALLLEAGP